MSDEFYIEELEALIDDESSRYGRLWSTKEDGVLQRYYNRVPSKALTEFLPGRTKIAIQRRAAALGLTNR